MTKGYKILISILAIIFSLGATGIGGGIVGGSSLKLGMRFVCNFFFIVQSVSTFWIVIGLFRKEKAK